MTCAAQAAEVLGPLVDSSESLLDAGLRRRVLLLVVRDRGFEADWHGLDYTPEMVELARTELAPRAGLDPDRFQLGTIEHLDGEFDNVLCFNVLTNSPHYALPLERLLANCRKRILLREVDGRRAGWSASRPTLTWTRTSATSASTTTPTRSTRSRRSWRRWGFSRHADPRPAHRRRHRDGRGHPPQLADPARGADRLMSRICGIAGAGDRLDRDADGVRRGRARTRPAGRGPRPPRRWNRTGLARGGRGASARGRRRGLRPRRRRVQPPGARPRVRARHGHRADRGPLPAAWLRGGAPAGSTASSPSPSGTPARRPCGWPATAWESGRCTTATAEDGLAFASRPRPLLELPGVSKALDQRFVGVFAGSHYRYFDNRPEDSPYRDVGQLPAGTPDARPRTAMP